MPPVTPSADALIAWSSVLGGSLPAEVAKAYTSNARDELAPWRASGIEASDLERSLSSSSALQRYQIVDRVLYGSHVRRCPERNGSSGDAWSWRRCWVGSFSVRDARVPIWIWW